MTFRSFQGFTATTPTFEWIAAIRIKKLLKSSTIFWTLRRRVYTKKSHLGFFFFLRFWKVADRSAISVRAAFDILSYLIMTNFIQRWNVYECALKAAHMSRNILDFYWPTEPENMLAVCLNIVLSSSGCPWSAHHHCARCIIVRTDEITNCAIGLRSQMAVNHLPSRLTKS